jgi:6-phosphogluconolactonase
MTTNNLPTDIGPSTTSSRRGFLMDAAAFAISGSALAQSRRSRPAARKRTVLAYVGTYSTTGGDSPGNGQGIYLLEMNPTTGVLTQREVFENHSNPSWLALNPAGTTLYAGDETTSFEGANSGSVSAYSVDRSNGRLRLLNTVSSQGAGPAHLSVHPSGKYVFVANYAGGTIAVLPVLSNGELGAATDVKHDKGKVGPTRASSAPPGNFAISGHDAPHAHMIMSDPSGRFVISTDLAMDKILVWKFDLQKGTLSPNSPASISLPPGDGPRHFAFHPNGHWMYSLQEEGSTVTFFGYDEASGRLTVKQAISSLPPGFAGTNFGSEIKVAPSGRFLYAANRLHNSIAAFSIGATGRLTFLDAEWTRGDYPRNFSIDPTGNFLLACNQRSDAITTFRVNPKTGRLIFTGRYTPVGAPSAVIFLT